MTVPCDPLHLRRTQTRRHLQSWDSPNAGRWLHAYHVNSGQEGGYSGGRLDPTVYRGPVDQRHLLPGPPRSSASSSFEPPIEFDDTHGHHDFSGSTQTRHLKSRRTFPPLLSSESNMLSNSLQLVAFLLAGLACSVLAASRTSPPSGSVIVRAGTTASGEYKTVQAAVNALPNDSSSRVIFIFPGTYNEQVYITRSGPLTIYGYTTDTLSYGANQVTIQAGVPASTAGSNDASGTLRIHKNDFKMYNVNVKNTYGVGSQAIAISQYGSRVGLYACGFYGYQDTLYANQGTQVYLRGYIEGATDFIFGRQGYAYFGGNTIAVKNNGWVTASGRESNDGGSYVFNQNTVVLAAGASSNANGKVYLGRPWGAYAKVIFKNTVITAPLNKAIWSVWNTGDERTSNVFFAEYNSSGSGVSGATRPSFARVLSASEANNYSISSAVGSDYANWVDMTYFV